MIWERNIVPVFIPLRMNKRGWPLESRDKYQLSLTQRGYGSITTEILDAPPFYYAEDYHQQYLAKNPGGYCGLGGTGVSFPEAGNGCR